MWLFWCWVQEQCSPELHCETFWNKNLSHFKFLLLVLLRNLREIFFLPSIFVIINFVFHTALQDYEAALKIDPTNENLISDAEKIRSVIQSSIGWNEKQLQTKSGLCKGNVCFCVNCKFFSHFFSRDLFLTGFVLIQDSCGFLKSTEKSLAIFQPAKFGKKSFFRLSVWKEEIIFQTSPFYMHSDDILFWDFWYDWQFYFHRD